MISLGARIVKSAIRLYTFKYRRRQMSLSRNLRIKPRGYTCPKGFEYSVQIFNGVKVEQLIPLGQKQDTVILHFHGGGGAIGMDGLFYRLVAQKYAKISGLTVYSIDYSTGLDKVHPSFLNDCYAAYMGLIDSGIDPQNIIAVGDSMGANLMLAVCLKARDEGKPLPKALISVCAFADCTASGESYRKNCHKDPMYALPYYMSADKYADRLRRVPPYVGQCDASHPYISPAFGDFSGFPEMMIVVGDCEVDESDSDMIYSRAVEAGVRAEYKKYKGMFHDFLYMIPFIKESKKAWKDIAAFISQVKDKS